MARDGAGVTDPGRTIRIRRIFRGRITGQTRKEILAEGAERIGAMVKGLQEVRITSRKSAAQRT